MQPGHRGHRANRGRKATPEMLAPKAKRVIQEPQGHKVRKVMQARKAQREIPVQLELLGLRGQKAIKEIPANKARRVSKVLKESRVLRGIQENKDPRALVFLMAVQPDNFSVKRNPALNG